MHASSIENMQRCVDWYLPPGRLAVVDLGASDVNGSYRSLMPDGVHYTGLDLEPGPGVDLVMADPYHIPMDDASFDVVLSGQMLEHCAHFWRVFTEIARVLRPGGLAFLIAPSAGPIHRYPVDCYRFYPDAYRALADWSGLRLVHCWMDERGPWRDLVGVFQKGGSLTAREEPRQPPAAAPLDPPAAAAADERIQGARPYREVLAWLHDQLLPGLYLEIGVRRGESLRLARGASIAIDPEPDLPPGFDLADRDLYRMGSDDFFFFKAASALQGRKVGLGFIDGMHRVDYALRDFMNLERHMAPGGVIAIDDVLPNSPLQAGRDRRSRVWCGDVWRLVPLLRRLRPDLRLTLLDTAPSGLLLISGLDPASRVLWDSYNPELRVLLAEDPPPPPFVLNREGALAPEERVLRQALGLG
jgi:predicted O-methyltransferase YrrM